MSTLIVDELAGFRDDNHLVKMDNNTILYHPGAVLQTVWRQSNTHQTYNSYNDNTSRPLAVLNLDNVTLKRADSHVHLHWYIFYEAHHNITFQALRDSNVIGYNTEVGDVKYSGIGCAEYEHSHDQNSTPSLIHLTYVDEPGSVGPFTYSIGTRASGTTNFDFRLNRAWGNYTEGYPGGVSWAILQEIAT